MRWDLQQIGVDLAEWYAAGRWVALLDLIDMLPAACRLNEAIANDPEAAREIAAQPKSSRPWTPRVSEFDLQAVMGREILGSLDRIRQTIEWANKKTPKPGKPFPIPYTEIDRATAALEREFAEDVAALFGFSPDDL